MPSAISASRLRAVDDTMRTSTADLGASAYTLECLIDQHAQNLVLRLARQISNVVDEQACRRAPLRGAPALRPSEPLDWSTPKSSISMRSGVIAAALITTKGPFTRPDS